MLTINSNQLKTFFGVSTEKNQDPSPMEKLPAELKERLASFLSPRELLNLAETSKSISSDLNLSIASSPLTDRASQDKHYRSRVARCFAVVIPKELLDNSRAHSMAFTCSVQNHGFTNPPAEVSIFEQDLPLSQHPDYLQRMHHTRGKVVAGPTSPLARSNNSKLSLSFPVKSNKFYQFYIRTHGQEEYDIAQCSDMTLHRVGFTKKSTEYTAYQFDVFERPEAMNFRRVGMKK